MSITKEQLMIPRVLCIGGEEGKPNYPGSPFNTGDILTYNGNAIWLNDVLRKVKYRISQFNQFPHLFRPMEWWEGRTAEEMPEYVKHKNTGSMLSIKDWYISPSLKRFAFNDDEGNEVYPDVKNYIPATLEEYEAYQKQKEG